ncbi:MULTISPECIES: hypothetical protein [Nostoc]|uniref:Transposase n=1 Tax=Nostoc paludosum FACHB-159 TaxID=2692908 RepID=A0ABR8KKY5_9NOSO|nr:MULTISPECIES: hypothetical protein [Nostoc]MBD2683105.1 hypothetical protein [Nostoc sp. FACHB-857]MBD2739466.1 hypothetical protein [Nostoc paludosum FACHB-159]
MTRTNSKLPKENKFNREIYAVTYLCFYCGAIATSDVLQTLTAIAPTGVRSSNKRKDPPTNQLQENKNND